MGGVEKGVGGEERLGVIFIINRVPGCHYLFHVQASPQHSMLE